MSAKQKPTIWQKIRKAFTDIHLWLGLASGLIVIAICLSGTVYVFNTEIREFASPELYYVNIQGNASPVPIDELIEETETKTGGKVTSFKTYHNPERTWQLTVTMPVVATSEKEAKPVNYRIDPYTGEIKGDLTNLKNNTTETMSWMFSLHRWLLLDRIKEPIFDELPNRKLGSYISGTATILFTLGLITGLIIWFPNKLKNWKQGLKIKWNGNWKRINHDLHNSLAFYSLFFLIIMGLTGPQWSFPWYREGLQKTLGTYKPQDAPSPPQLQSTLPEKELIRPSVAQYIVAANQVLDYPGDYTITLPTDSHATVAIAKVHAGFFAPAASDRLQLDQYSAATLKLDIFKEKPFNERIAGSIKALHVGDVYGKFSKIIYFITCLIATTLPVTGTIIWINKLRKKKKKTKKKGSLKSPVSYPASA